MFRPHEEQHVAAAYCLRGRAQGYALQWPRASRRGLAQRNTKHGALFLDSDTQLHDYRSLLDRMERKALSQKASRDFIHALAREL